MINYQLGFVFSLLGHILILLVITLDFSIFLPKEKIFEVIPIGFVQENNSDIRIVRLKNCLFINNRVEEMVLPK